MAITNQPYVHNCNANRQGCV